MLHLRSAAPTVALLLISACARHSCGRSGGAVARGAASGGVGGRGRRLARRPASIGAKRTRRPAPRARHRRGRGAGRSRRPRPGLAHRGGVRGIPLSAGPSKRDGRRACWRSEACSITSPRSRKALDARRAAGRARRGRAHRRPRSRKPRRARRRARRDRIAGREFQRRRGGAGALLCALRPAGDFRLQDREHARQHDRPPLAALSRFRLGGGAARRSAEPRAGAACRRCSRRWPRWHCPERARRAGFGAMLRDGAKASLAQCRLARSGGGGRAGLGARRPAPLSTARWSTAHGSAKAAPARRRPTSRARCASIPPPASSRRRWCWPH